MQNRPALGIRTIVNLRSKHGDRDQISDSGFGFHPMWVNVRSWFRDLDMAAIADAAGLPEPSLGRRSARNSTRRAAND